MLKPDLKVITERSESAIKINTTKDMKNEDIEKLLSIYAMQAAKYDIPALLKYIAKLEAVAEAAREYLREDGAIPDTELASALAKLDGDG